MKVAWAFEKEDPKAYFRNFTLTGNAVKPHVCLMLD